MKQSANLNTSPDVPDEGADINRFTPITNTRDYDLDQLVNDLDLLVPEAPTIREKIMLIERELQKLPQADLDVRHHFLDGLYAREIFIPKGAILTGEIHKTEHLNIISKGEITILTEDGVKKIRAPFTITSRAGVKKVGHAHEDTIWTTIHATKETDLKRIEEELIAKDFDDPELIHRMSIKVAKEFTCLLP